MPTSGLEERRHSAPAAWSSRQGGPVQQDNYESLLLSPRKQHDNDESSQVFSFLWEGATIPPAGLAGGGRPGLCPATISQQQSHNNNNRTTTTISQQQRSHNNSNLTSWSFFCWRIRAGLWVSAPAIFFSNSTYSSIVARSTSPSWGSPD